MQAQPGGATPRSPLHAVTPVGLLMLAAAPVLAWAVTMTPAPTGALPVSAPWWVLALLFAGGHALALNLQTAGEARSVSVTELPFVVGLLLTSPVAFCLARLVGCLAGQGVCRGQWRRPLKLAFNVAVVAAEAPLGILIYRGLAYGGSKMSPATWAAAVVAAIVVSLVTGAAVSIVIARIEGTRFRALGLWEVLQTSAPQALAFGLVGVVAVLALAATRWAVLPLALVTLASVAFHHAYARFVERHETAERLHLFSQALTGQIDPDRIVATMLEQARAILHADVACLTFFSGDDRFPDSEAAIRGDGPLERGQARYLTREAGWMVDRLGSGRPLLFSRDTKELAARHWLTANGLREALLMPLRDEQGSSGVLIVCDRRGDSRGFKRADLQLLETVANHGSTALRHGELLSRLRHESLHDALTGVPNRSFFQERVEQLFAALPDGGRPFAVAMIDLDSFKEVNDTLGHDRGDRLLQEVAGRFSAAIDDRGLLSRFGGDEFTVVLPECRDMTAAVLRCHALLTVLAEPVVIDGLVLNVSASVGVALAPEQASTAAELLRRADVAMYAAKSERRGVVAYDADHDTSSPTRLAMASALRQAIADERLSVCVQPQISLASGEVVCVEALARWNDPERGFVPPDEFIPLAERLGLIGPLTDLVLDQAIGACAAWQARSPGVGIAVNMSAWSLRDESFDERVGRLLRRHGLDAHLLTLELTESTAMSDPERTIDRLKQLRARGVRLSIDDFGTGYSSLAYLRRLPVQEVKVDRSFVLRMDVETEDAAIVRSIIDLARALELEVVAEGVETATTLAMLNDLGCDLAQGYHISRPIPVEEFGDWLGRSLWRAPQARRLVAVGAEG